ncbi:hypothetical protein QL285_083272 [Trifolium repens]|nr:hypothetical protein QL285_083272 [Trifolium repens]
MHRRRPIGHLRHEILICKDKTQALYSKHHGVENFSEVKESKGLICVILAYQKSVNTNQEHLGLVNCLDFDDSVAAAI